MWSSDSNATHNPPSDVVMKGKRWFVGDEMKTVLTDNEEKVIFSLQFWYIVCFWSVTDGICLAVK